MFDLSLCACDGLFLLPVEEKAFSGLPQAPTKCPLGFRGSVKLLNLLKLSCFPMDFGELLKPDNPGARDGLGVCLQWMALWACSRWAFPPACRGKGYFEAPWGCSRSSFSLACRGKGYFEVHLVCLRSSFPRACLGKDDCIRAFPPACRGTGCCDGMFPLPVKEKAISWISGPLWALQASLGLSGSLWSSLGLSLSL